MTATNIMTTTSMSRMVLLAFVAAGGIPLVLAIQHFRREPPIDTKAATAAPGVSKPASGAQDQRPDALAAAQAKADAVAAALAGSPVPPGTTTLFHRVSLGTARLGRGRWFSDEQSDWEVEPALSWPNQIGDLQAIELIGIFYSCLEQCRKFSVSNGRY
jgi:hypothetical protein